MNKILYPFILIIENLYDFLYTSINNFGTSLILLSIITSILMFFLKSLLKKFPERERQIQAILQPQIDKINKETTGVEKHQRISNLYKRYGYHPVLALRAAIPIFIQLPFLFAAYYILNNYEAFKGISFLGIKDLSRPDLLLSHSGIISFSISLLPVLMTTINICSAFLIPKFNKKSRNQSIVISLFLLVLLYKSSSALLIYWTVNNIVFALGAIYLRLKYNKSINYNYQNALSIKYNYNKV
ncbi:MAG: YidC/Oxa1 family membrane protein insertase, partial [Candidatus Aminicenantes bacterium]|nr:YidC/Oxa1 family membrane protein insertase [Candidatus Aminicenantes bacterium]